MNRLIASALAALALASVAAPAALAEGKTSSMRVSYAGLNLASPEGAKTMLARLEKASRKVCNAATLRSPEEMEWAETCIADAMDKAVARLNAPVVTAMFMDAQRFEMASR